MSQKIEISFVEGLLHIAPFPEYLQKDLKFYDMVPKMVPFSYRDRKTGKIIEGERKDGYVNVASEMFTRSENTGGAFTHRGLFRRISNLVKKHGDTLCANQDSSLPSFEFNRSVVEGLREEQVRVLLNILAELGSGQVGWQTNPGLIQPAPASGGALVEATMSTGKTHIIAAFIKCFPGVQVLVVTKKKSVMQRLVDGLTELLPNEDIGVFHGSKKRMERITVCSEALLDAFDTSQVRVIVYDEVHNASGEQVSSVLLCYTKAVKLGLSGTLKDHKRKKFLQAIFGPVVDTITDEEADEKDMVSPVKVYALHVPEGPDVADYGEIPLERWGITRNKKRNRLIKSVADLVPNDMQLIIFVRTIEHIEELVAMMPWFTVYHGQLSSKDRTEIEKGIMSGELKRIIANDALSEGVNTVKLRVMIEAGWSIGDQTVSQRGGRNRRKDPGKKLGVIVTFLDDWEIPDQIVGMMKVNPLKGRAESRISNYRARKWPVLKIRDPMEINFSEIQEP